MNSVDQKIDHVLHELGALGADGVVVCFGSSLGIAQRTRGYAELYGWHEVIIDCSGSDAAPDRQIETQGLDHIDVLHVETKRRDWRILKQIDLKRFGPRMIRMRRTGLRGAELFLAVRHLNQQGYAIEWFYDELIGLLPRTALSGKPMLEEISPVAASAPHEGRAALYVISYNSPDQFRLWVEFDRSRKSGIASLSGPLPARQFYQR